MGITQRLENWGRWARDRRRYNHCASIEHRYRSPQTWHPPQPKIPVDVLDAQFVQDVIAWAVDKRVMTPSHSKALKYAFIEPGYNRWKAAAKCGVYTPRKLEVFIHESKVRFTDALELCTGVRYPTRDNLRDGRFLAQPDFRPMGGAAVAAKSV